VAGQTATKMIGGSFRRVRAGIVDGTVSLEQALGPGASKDVGVPVASFAFRVPYA
jgi:hypothetical protein